MIHNIKQNILLRVTPGIDCHTHDYIKTGHLDSKFGFDLTQLDEIISKILSDYNFLNIVGLHAHIGSQIFQCDAYKDVIDVQVRAIAAKLMISVICWYYMSLKNFDKRDSKLMKFLLVIDFILFLIGSKILYAERITYYYSCLVYTYALSRGVTIAKNGVYNKIFIALILLLYFYIIFVLLGIGTIMPYTIQIV